MWDECLLSEKWLNSYLWSIPTPSPPIAFYLKPGLVNTLFLPLALYFKPGLVSTFISLSVSLPPPSVFLATLTVFVYMNPLRGAVSLSIYQFRGTIYLKFDWFVPETEKRF